MARFAYPSAGEFREFVSLLRKADYPISRYLPTTGDAWLEAIQSSIDYARQTEAYAGDQEIEQACARLLYKIVKKHELGDGNKRSGVIAVFLFALLNDREIDDPVRLKALAKRIARTRGRSNEDLVCARAAAEMRALLSPETRDVRRAA